MEPVLPGTRLTAWVLSQFPPPPARILEVGCGNGRLARALDRAGYDVVAVDPEAPAGRIFRRCLTEEVDEPTTFHAAVASRSLHHVEDLSKVLDKICSLLRPRARFVVNEFACDRLDAVTARWFSAGGSDCRFLGAEASRRGRRRRAIEVEANFSGPLRVAIPPAGAGAQISTAAVRLDALFVRLSRRNRSGTNGEAVHRAGSHPRDRVSIRRHPEMRSDVEIRWKFNGLLGRAPVVLMRE